MRPYRDSRLTYIALSAFFVAVIGYAGFEARGIIRGPSITLSTTITESTKSFVVIEGHAERIASLKMNGRAIAVTEMGEFAEPYLLAPGYNRIVLDATDRYGRTRSQVVEMVYTGAPIERQRTETAPPSTETSPTTTPEASPLQPIAD